VFVYLFGQPRGRGGMLGGDVVGPGVIVEGIP